MVKKLKLVTFFTLFFLLGTSIQAQTVMTGTAKTDGLQVADPSFENWSQKFGKNNDWKESGIREYLNGEFAEMIEKKIGCELPEFERDLLSMDGQTEYGFCSDKVSLISVDEYRKYRRFIPNGKDGFWWTITPDSTKCNNDTTCIRVVSPSGDFINDYYYGLSGVRPFCIFPSSIFESEEE